MPTTPARQQPLTQTSPASPSPSSALPGTINTEAGAANMTAEEIVASVMSSFAVGGDRVPYEEALDLAQNPDRAEEYTDVLGEILEHKKVPLLLDDRGLWLVSDTPDNSISPRIRLNRAFFGKLNACSIVVMTASGMLTDDGLAALEEDRFLDWLDREHPGVAPRTTQDDPYFKAFKAWRETEDEADNRNHTTLVLGRLEEVLCRLETHRAPDIAVRFQSRREVGGASRGPDRRLVREVRETLRNYSDYVRSAVTVYED